MYFQSSSLVWHLVQDCYEEFIKIVDIPAKESWIEVASGVIQENKSYLVLI